MTRGDWQLAALVVALVVVPGAVDGFEARLARMADNASSDLNPSGPERWVAGRHVRPPRSC